MSSIYNSFLILKKSIYLRIVLTITLIAVVIISLSLFMGTRLFQTNLTRSLESDLLTIADITDKFISSEIQILKFIALDAARDIELSFLTVGDYDLERNYYCFPNLIGLAVYSQEELIDYFGAVTLSENLQHESFMLSAFNGKQGLSSTVLSPDGALVMYVSTPMADGLVLAAAIEGHHFHDLVHGVRIYNSGHIFIEDSTGVMIANYRRHWVDARMNVIEYALLDPSFAEAAAAMEITITGERGIASYSIEGQSRIIAHRSITGSNEGWVLGVVAPSTETPLRDVPGGMFLIGVVTLALSIVASLFAASSMKKPYREADILKVTAETASLAKSRFLANTSHEMRTPLNVIIGLTDLILLDNKESLENTESIKKIRTAGLTVLGIVNDILDLSKIESGKLELLPVKYETASLINDTATLNTIRIADKPIDFCLSLEDSLFSQLYGDDLRLKQILNNLLSNAFKYTKKGTVELKILSSIDETQNVWLDVYVKDSGVGIREEDIPKLFEDFSQVDTKANRLIEGTGLGLPITKKLVEMMGGSISVESEYGHGSTFCVRVMQGYVSDERIGSAVAEKLVNFNYIEEKRDEVYKLQPFDLSYARVLVVDDFEANLNVAAGLLSRYKLNVDCVTSGQEAIDLIAAQSPVYDTVFMDYMMPEMDGLEATKRIRTIDSDYAKNLTIIALTADAIVGNEEKFYQHGFDGFLSKPIDLGELDNLLRKWVRDRAK